jgi:prolyl oligopeptidase
MRIGCRSRAGGPVCAGLRAESGRGSGGFISGRPNREAMRPTVAALIVLSVILTGPLFVFGQMNAHPDAPRFAYPPAPRSTASNTFFGTTVADPYRPLEAIDAPATKAWIAAENRLTHGYLDAIPARPAIAAAFRKLYNYPKMSAPERAGRRYFYSYNTGLQTQGVIYVRDGEHGRAHVFFDPNTLSKDGSVQLTATAYSRDGKYLAYSTSTGGEDWQTWHVKTVATGRDTHDLIHWSKFSDAAWDGDRGFYYSGYDAPAAQNKTLSVLGVQKVWFHRLGTSQSADRLAFASTAHPDRFASAEVTDDDRYVVLAIGTLDTTQLMWKTRAAPDTAFRPLTPYTANVDYTVLGNDGSRFYLSTNNRAPRFRIVAVDARDPGLEQRTIVAQSADKLDGAALIGNRFLVSYLHDAYSVVRAVATSGRPLGAVALPGLGSASTPSARREDRSAYFQFSSYAFPTTIYRLDTRTLRTQVYFRPPIPFDSGAFVTEQLYAISKDGTRVPVFVTHRKGLVLDGRNPTLLYGYGGFDISETPYYSTHQALWLKLGGVYADAVLRGGGEFGETWHDAGRLANKQHVFDDFTAAARMLIARKITSTPKLAIDGGSNGGLLVGATLVQHPELFGAAIAEQGVLDMLRYARFTVGKAWIPEYGDATASAAAFHWLYAYSPLHNVKPGVRYPPTLITTADHDDRVMPAHSFKFVAALQAAQGGRAPILLRVQTNEGHFSGLTTDESIALYADFFAFLVKSLDFRPHVPGA